MKKRLVVLLLSGALTCGLLAGCGGGSTPNQPATNENVSSENKIDLTEVADKLTNFEFNEVVIETDNTWGSLIFTDSEFYLYDAKAGDSVYDGYTQNGKLYVSQDGSAFERSRADVPSVDTYKDLLSVMAENLKYDSDNREYSGSLQLADVKNSFSDYTALMEYKDEALSSDTLQFTADISDEEISILIDDFYSLRYKTTDADPVELIKESIISNADTNLKGIVCYNPDSDEELTLNEANLVVSDDFILQIKAIGGETEKLIDVADIEITDSEVKINGVSYLLTTRSQYQETKGEEEKLAKIRLWKDAYIGYLNTIGFKHKEFELIDLLEDGIPEFVYRVEGATEVYGMYYIDANYVVHDLGTGANITQIKHTSSEADVIVIGDKIDLSRPSNTSNIFYHNKATGTWDLVFKGVEDNPDWYIDGELVGLEYYQERFSELAPIFGFVRDLNRINYHTESATDFIEMYEAE